MIATGSSPLIPPIPGLDKVPYFTNETIFDNREKLDHLIVIGGGPVGLELAQAHLRLGSRVTVIEAAQALGNDDPELAEVVLKRLQAEGLEIRQGASVERVERRHPADRRAYRRGRPQVGGAGHAPAHRHRAQAQRLRPQSRGARPSSTTSAASR